MFLDLPAAVWSNRPVVLWPSAEGTFPGRAAQTAAFHQRGRRSGCLLGAPGSGPGSVLPFDGVTLCTVQDGRDFGADCYQAYPRILTGSARRNAGQEYRLAMTILPDDSTEVTIPRIARWKSQGEPGLNVLGGGTGDRTAIRAVRGLVSGRPAPEEKPRTILSQVARSMRRFTVRDGPRPDRPGVSISRITSVRILTAPSYLCPHGGAGVEGAIRARPVPGCVEVVIARMTQTRGQTIETPEQTFHCTPAKGEHGYVRVSRENPRYFEYDDGAPFFGIAMNMATLGGPGDSVRPTDWYTRFAAAGGNYVRSWWCADGTDLESHISGHLDVGLGKFRQEDSWRID